jgi:hypothetical protein
LEELEVIDVNPFGARRRDPEKAAQIKGWAREAFDVKDDVTIMVTELRCTEPDCPPLETVIALMQADASKPIQHKLHKPLAEVSRDDVASLAAQPHNHIDH